MECGTKVLLLMNAFSFLCVADLPQVTAHPVDQTNVAPGSDVTFSVTATGTKPLSYQWQKDGVNLSDGGSISGATTATLTITGVMESDEGGFRCVVTNIAGTNISDTATLALGKDISNNRLEIILCAFSASVWSELASSCCH